MLGFGGKTVPPLAHDVLGNLDQMPSRRQHAQRGVEQRHQ